MADEITPDDATEQADAQYQQRADQLREATLIEKNDRELAKVCVSVLQACHREEGWSVTDSDVRESLDRLTIATCERLERLLMRDLR